VNDVEQKPAEAPRDHAHHSFLSAAKLIAACTLMSLLLALVRDMMMAAYLGGGLVASAFAIAWTVPNLFRRLFGEGAVSSAFIPAFTLSLKTRPNEDTQKLFSVTFTVMLLVLAAVTVLVEFAACGLRWGVGLSAPKTRLLLEYTAMLMPYMLMICLTAFFMAVLNSYKHFFAPAIMPVLLNVVWIGALAVIRKTIPDPEVGATWLAGAILFGGLVQMLFQVPFALKHGMRLRLSLDYSHPGFRQVLRLWGPVIIGSAAVQLNMLVDKALALFAVEDPGAAAFLQYGSNLMHFPLSLIAVAVSTAVLPSLADHAAGNEVEAFKRTLMSAVRMTLFLAIPAGIGLMALAGPIVEVIYRRQAFTPHAAMRTAWVVFFYSIGVWAQTGTFVLLRGYYALKDTRTPVKVSALVVLFNLGLNLTFVWFMAEAGLALATSLSGMAQFVVLLAILRRRLGPLGGTEAARSSLRTLAVSLVMGAAAALGWHFRWPGSAGIAARAGMLAALLVVSVSIFVAGCLVLRMPELRDLLRFRRR
jgi:putative peptidoglycan lipid II flippase